MRRWTPRTVGRTIVVVVLSATVTGSGAGRHQEAVAGADSTVRIHDGSRPVAASAQGALEPIAYELREVPGPHGSARVAGARYYELVRHGAVVPGPLVRCVPTGVGGPDACELDRKRSARAARTLAD